MAVDRDYVIRLVICHYKTDLVVSRCDLATPTDHQTLLASSMSVYVQPMPVSVLCMLWLFSGTSCKVYTRQKQVAVLETGTGDAINQLVNLKLANADRS